MEKYANATNPNGTLFVSGFYTSDIEDIVTVASNYGFTLSDQQEDSDWTSLKFKKGQ